MKPICVPCQSFFRPAKNGFAFTEGMPVGEARPGKIDADKWRPYKLWMGDKWKCPDCGAEIIVGTGLDPISVHHEQDFLEKQKRFGCDQFQVNDC